MPPVKQEVREGNAPRGRGRATDVPVNWHDSPGLQVTAVGAVLCALLLLILPFFLPANQDVAWNLHVGRRLLLGDRLFVDVVEVNPPLILWLGSGIAWLASVSTVGGMQLYRLLVVIAIAACVLAVYRTLARDLGRERARVVAGTLLAVLAGLPGYNFGQREHLALVLAVPYLVAASAGGGGVIAGLAAGAGFALKPHFLAALIAVEGLRYARGQSVLRPALYAVVAVLLSCTSCVLLFLPEYLPAARSLGPAYWRLHQLSVAAIVFSPLSVLTAVVTGSTWWLNRRGSRAALVDVLLAASAGFLLAALLQRKGYEYHFLPALSLATAALLLTAARSNRLLLPALAGALVLATTTLIRARLGDAEDTEIAAAIRKQAGGLPVLALSDHAFLATLTDRAGVEFDSPYPYLWPLPVLYPPGSRLSAATSRSALELRMLDGIWRQVERHAPGLVMIERHTAPWLPAGFDLRGYFSADVRFAALLSRCSARPRIQGYEVCFVNGATR